MGRAPPSTMSDGRSRGLQGGEGVSRAVSVSRITPYREGGLTWTWAGVNVKGRMTGPGGGSDCRGTGEARGGDWRQWDFQLRRELVNM